MSEGEKKEKESPKIEGCETGNILMTDTLEPIKFRGCEIVLRVRELTKLESLWLSNEYAKLNKLGSKIVNKTKILSEEITITEKQEMTSRLLVVSQALRLGVIERLGNEGWSGVQPKLIADEKIRSQFKANDEVPCTLENVLALSEETRTKIVLAISNWFSPVTEADVKNLSGE